MAYYLGIDGGGSKTTCSVGDEFAVLASAVSGPSNITRVGETGAREALHQSITEACGSAKIDPRELQCSCIGAAGAGHKEINRIVQKIVAEVIPGKIEVVGDMEIALQAAFGSGPGVTVIGGTGSIAFGRDANGKTARAGGWGFTISDEGSAHWIGRAAVAAVLRTVDESEQDQSPVDRTTKQSSPLFDEMKSIWAVETFDQLARTANANGGFAALLPAVLAADQAGDELARSILTQAGAALARLASLVVRRLFSGSQFAVPVAMVGGVFRYAPRVREVFYSQLRTAHPQVTLNPEVVEPVHGALQLARRFTSLAASSTKNSF